MKNTKICKACQKTKNVNKFYKNKSSKDRLAYICKKCSDKSVFNYYKTKKGLISRIYSTQKSHSKQKGYIPPSYTKQELIDWLFDQKLFHKLYYNWVKSGYEKDLVPSVDRPNDYKGYSLDNIQLMTWRENMDKSYLDRINGVNNKQSKAVLQYDLAGNFIREYYSINQAMRETGIKQSHICSTCVNRLKQTGGFIWKFKDSPELIK